MPQNLVQSAAARYASGYVASKQGQIGLAANPTGVTTTVGLATTYTGLVLSNPAGSGKNLVLLNVAGSFIVAPTTITTLALIAGYAAAGITVHTTPLTPVNGLLGGGNPLVGLADSAATLVGTPAFVRSLGQAATATTAPAFSADINGSIIIRPGGYVAIGTNIAGPASGLLGSFMWDEEPA